MNLNPALAVTSAVIGLTAAVAGYVKKSNEAREAKINEIFEEATEASNALADSVKENSDKMKELADSSDETAAKELALTDQTKALWEELQTLVDNIYRSPLNNVHSLHFV